MHFPYEHHLKLTEILIAFTQCGTSGKERKWGESGWGWEEGKYGDGEDEAKDRLGRGLGGGEEEGGRRRRLGEGLGLQSMRPVPVFAF